MKTIIMRNINKVYNIGVTYSLVNHCRFALQQDDRKWRHPSKNILRKEFVALGWRLSSNTFSDNDSDNDNFFLVI